MRERSHTNMIMSSEKSKCIRIKNLMRKFLTMIDWSRLYSSKETNLSNSSSYFYCFIAYGKLDTAKNWTNCMEIMLNRLHYEDALRILFISAVNASRKSGCESVFNVPFECVMELLTRFNWKVDGELMAIFLKCSENELAKLARMKTEDPFLLDDLPSVWEALFLQPKGLAYKIEN